MLALDGSWKNARLVSLALMIALSARACKHAKMYIMYILDIVCTM